MTTRETLFHRQDGKCFYCERTMHLEWGAQTSITRDHRIPWARGGRGLPRNTVGACYRCNMLKGSMSEDEFRKRWPNGPGNFMVGGPNPPGHRKAKKTERARRKAIVRELREAGAL